MSGKSSSELQWTGDKIELLFEATQNLKVEKDYKKLNWKLTTGLNSDVMVVPLHTKCKMKVLKFFSFSRNMFLFMKSSFT